MLMVVFGSIVFFFGGCWILLNPSKVFMKGQFATEKGYRQGEQMAMFLGGGMVFLGVMQGVNGLLGVLLRRVPVVSSLTWLAGIGAGIYAVLHVRREMQGRTR
jgi:hypothetical protein